MKEGAAFAIMLPMDGAVILAAGRGERMGGADKALVRLMHRPMLEYSLSAFDECPDIGAIAIVVREQMAERIRELVAAFAPRTPVTVVTGGARRQDSAMAGLRALPSGTGIVAIHDAARPLVTPELISLCLASARATGSGVAARKAVDTLKECLPGTNRVLRTPDRGNLWTISTPQAFRMDYISAALSLAASSGDTVTDDATAMELAGHEVRLVEWNPANIKVTFPEDIAMAEAALMSRKTPENR